MREKWLVARLREEERIQILYVCMYASGMLLQIITHKQQAEQITEGAQGEI